MDNRPLVLLPGTLCDARVWEHQVAAFGAEREVIVCELGAERTLADEVARCLRSLPPTFLLAGFSLGGIAAFEFFRQAKERIAGMALLSTNARADTDASRKNRSDLLSRVEAGQLSQVLDEVLLPLYVSPECEGGDDVMRVISDMAHATSVRFRNQCAYASDRPDSRDLLSEMVKPAASIHGAGDRVTPIERQSEIAAGMPHATVMVVSGSGHFVTLEAPDVCNRALADWMNRSIC